MERLYRENRDNPLEFESKMDELVEAMSGIQYGKSRMDQVPKAWDQIQDLAHSLTDKAERDAKSLGKDKYENYQKPFCDLKGVVSKSAPQAGRQPLLLQYQVEL